MDHPIQASELHHGLIGGNPRPMMDPTIPAPVVAIRPARRDDLPAIGRLGVLLVRMHHDFDPERFVPATSGTEDGYAAFLGAQLKKESTTVLVAEREGTVLGYAFAVVEGYDYMALRGPAGVLHDLVVDPAHRRSGVGRVLLDATIAALESAGAPRIVLSTAARNEAAQRFFARAGFRPTMVEMSRKAAGGGV